LLNDDQFFRAAYCNVHGDEKLKVHLWDAFGTEPEQLDTMIGSLTKWLGNDGVGDKWNIDCDRIEDAPNQLDQMNVEDNNQRIGYDVAALYLRRRLQAHHFGGTSTRFPFLSGMSYYLEDKRKVARALIEDILLSTSRMLPSIPESDVATPSEGLQRALIDGASSDKLGIFYIYYNVAGAGKTAQIFKLLSQRWGIYAISPTVPIEDSITASHLDEHLVMGPHRSFSSRDTFTLYSDVDSVTQTMGRHIRKIFATGRLVQTFVRARCELLEIYRSLRHNSPGQPSPLRWLQLQISCVTEAQDPFDMTYRLLRLLVMTKHDLSLYLGPDGAEHASDDSTTVQEGSQRQQQSDIAARYFCWDEMQTALTSELSYDMFHTICHMLRGISEGTVDLTNWLSPITYKHVILSGTSLNVQNLVDFFQKTGLVNTAKTAMENTHPRPRPGMSLSTTTQMPYVSDSDQFWRFYKTYISSIVTELVEHWAMDQKARVSQIPLLARSGRALPFEIPIEDHESFLQHCQTLKGFFDRVSHPLSDASKLETLKFVTERILFHCDNQKAADGVGERLQSMVKFNQENDSLEHFDLLDRPVDEISQHIRRFVAGQQDTDVGFLVPFLRVISKLCRKGQTEFVEALKAGLYKSNADPPLDLDQGAERLRDHCMWYLVDHYAKPFRGRYRWSAFFVEELMKRTSLHGRSVHSVRAVCQAAHNAVRSQICDALQGRLSQLFDDQQHKDLVSHLVKMAWRAYLLRVPSICKNERAMTLVREGFARTTQRDDGVVLDESLAVHAVMQFLRQHSQYYQEEMYDELNSSQLDRETMSLTGKMHELSIAMVSLPLAVTVAVLTY
jgi:hypothetical protein